jgi:hypothetical protein
MSNKSVIKDIACGTEMFDTVSSRLSITNLNKSIKIGASRVAEEKERQAEKVEVWRKSRVMDLLSLAKETTNKALNSASRHGISTITMSVEGQDTLYPEGEGVEIRKTPFIITANGMCVDAFVLIDTKCDDRMLDEMLAEYRTFYTKRGLIVSKISRASEVISMEQIKENPTGALYEIKVTVPVK